MNEPQCKSCTFFRQHYTLSENKLIEVNCGHCAYTRPKKRNPKAWACDNYAPGHGTADAFVTKTYLSKALLHHILNMELLPPIGTEEVP